MKNILVFIPLFAIHSSFAQIKIIEINNTGSIVFKTNNSITTGCSFFFDEKVDLKKIYFKVIHNITTDIIHYIDTTTHLSKFFYENKLYISEQPIKHIQNFIPQKGDLIFYVEDGRLIYNWCVTDDYFKLNSKQ